MTISNASANVVVGLVPGLLLVRSGHLLVDDAKLHLVKQAHTAIPRQRAKEVVHRDFHVVYTTTRQLYRQVEFKPVVGVDSFG